MAKYTLVGGVLDGQRREIPYGEEFHEFTVPDTVGVADLDPTEPLKMTLRLKFVAYRRVARQVPGQEPIVFYAESALSEAEAYRVLIDGYRRPKG